MTLGRAIATQIAGSAALRMAPPAAHGAVRMGAIAIDRASAIGRGARWAVAGARATRTMSGRGAPAGTVVAGEFLHGPGDITAAIAALSTDVAAFGADTLLHATSPADASWALAEIVPFVGEWAAFATTHERSALAPYLTSWSVLEDWRERLVRLRQFARARGIEISSAAPAVLAKTVWQRGEDGTGSGVDRLFALGKWIVYAAVGLLGVTKLYAVTTAIRNDATKASAA